jgi:hypothetical protein
VTPQHLKLATDDQSHWYSGIGVAASHQPHLDVSSTFAAGSRLNSSTCGDCRVRLLKRVHRCRL